ncbi:MAG: AAA family ATPase, partial [Tannerella sp.]|nr:AAA family ATPase [Tannerella sp.]
MIKEIIIRDFFSFKGEHKIVLNPNINVLLGINGSGKTSFLNAFKLLYEGVSGIGFEALFQGQWGGFHQVANVNSGESSGIELTYVFDQILNTSSPFDKNDVYYSIYIEPSGTSYTLREHLYTINSGKTEKFTYLDFKNGNGKLWVGNSSGSINFEDYKDGDISGQELVLRQITDPIRYPLTHTIR